MTYIKIACLDVYYYEDYAKACCIVFTTQPTERIIAKYYKIIKHVDKYISGEFYKRELPCLLAVYNCIREDIDLIIVDGYVWLNDGKKGLGAYLFEALCGKTPVIGVSKSLFKGCTDYLEVNRGQSSRPLYISCIGTELSNSAQLIKNLNGPYRIPEVVKEVDYLTRSELKV